MIAVVATAVKRETNMAKMLGFCGLILLAIAAVQASAAGFGYGCNVVCWGAAANGGVMLCKRKMRDAADAKDYQDKVAKNEIAAGKPITFLAGNKPEGASCKGGFPQTVSVLGYVGVNIGSFTPGPVKAGDIVTITGSGFVYDQRETLFFPDPAAP
jgi:hypothetical protein